MTDAALIKTVGDEIYHLVRGELRPKLVIDFRKVERLSSATLSMLIALQKVIARQSGQLRIANLNDDVADVFKLTGLDSVLKVCDSTEDAVTSFT
jgi:anti-sigma B factor antagonist